MRHSDAGHTAARSFPFPIIASQAHRRRQGTDATRWAAGRIGDSFIAISMTNAWVETLTCDDGHSAPGSHPAKPPDCVAACPKTRKKCDCDNKCDYGDPAKLGPSLSSRMDFA
jgi:hypothetical protein